jgi:hypothetical protein
LNTSDIRPCFVSSACVGGSELGDYCRVGHRGPYCNVCEEGFSKDLFGSCQKCPSLITNIVGTAVAVLGLIALAFALNFAHKKLRKNKKIEAASDAAACGLKILFVTYQILATLPSIIPNLILPENFLVLLNCFQFTKLNIFQFVSMGCVATGFNFYTLLLCATVFPLFVIVVLLLVGSRSSELRTRCFTVALAISYVVLPTVTTVIFGAFPCDDFFSSVERANHVTASYLRADYGISCESAEYKLFSFYAALMIFVVPIGIPVTYFVVLWRRRVRIKMCYEEREKDEELAAVSFLFDSFKPQFWWFEVAETCRRLALTGALGAIKPGTISQLAVGMLISMCGAVCYSWSMPYRNKSDNALQVLANFQVFVVMLSALVLKYRPSSADTIDQRSMGFLLIFLNLLGASTLFALMIVTVMGTAASENNRSRASSWTDVFIRHKTMFKRSPSGKEVPQITEGATNNIELESLYQVSGAVEIKVNPMQLQNQGGTFGVPPPPADLDRYKDST